MDELDLWLKYPLIVKRTENGDVVYEGTVTINDEDYKVTIENSREVSFKFTLPDKLIPHESDICSAVADLSKKTIVTVLDALVKVVTSKIPSTIPVNHCDIYKQILYEYSEFTRFYLNLKSSRLSPNLSKIDVSIKDDRNRTHSYSIAVNFHDDKYRFKIGTSDLPENTVVFKESSSLKVIHEQFVSAVEVLQPFFDLLDVFDSNCWILDPSEPKRSCRYRRINLGENISVIITLDPYNITSIPDMKFLGPERLVAAYRDKINENLELWMYENDVYSEILKLLGMDSFPRKTINEDEKNCDILKENGDCSICFSFRLNEKLPDVVCKTKSCENHYHTECLYEWLISVNARRFFDEVVGQCPNCEKNISCPIPK